MRRQLTITLAFLLCALLFVALPRSAPAAPLIVTTTTPAAIHAAAPSTASPSTASPPTASPSAASPSAAAPPAAAPSATSPSAAGAASARDACSLGGLVPTHGSTCPATGRLRRQFLGISVLPNPLHVVKKVVGGVASTAIKPFLAAILGWVASGAESALKETAKVIDDTTSPQLTSSWFSGSYWRVAGIAAVLTIPFLCAAAIHAIVRSDLALLTRAAFGYLPLSLLAVGIASQLTMLLLAATDEMSSIVASASLHADTVFLSTTSVGAIVVSVATNDPFVTFLAAIITVAATLALWLELLVRNAAVYVIVLMLPLFFAAMVWPARRTLAIRAIETLIALILSKFAIVAVLSLGGSALGHSRIPGAASVLTGATLVLLAAFTPWALLRMLPLHELASAAAGGLSQAPRQTLSTAARAGMELADGLVALGADGVERSALPDQKPGILGRGSSTAGRSSDTGDEPDREPWAEPVDADVANPVTGAMSAAPGASDDTGAVPGSPTDTTAAGEIAVGPTGADPSRSATERPGANTGSSQRWPDGLPFPEALTGNDPKLPLGEDLMELADERSLPPGANDNGNGNEQMSTEAARAPAPAPEPPTPPAEPPTLLAQDTIGPRTAEPRPTTGRTDADDAPVPRVAPPPDPGRDPFDEGA